jgi:hypothetical protein
MDIDFTDTLNARAARDGQDERHICPMALPAINRALELWTNKGDTVLSPFAGIASEGYCAVEKGRRFVGIELKGSYYAQAVKNMRRAGAQATLDLDPAGAKIEHALDRDEEDVV